MPEKYIVRGQKVTPGKIALAKELRRNMTAAEKTLWEGLRANRLNGWHFRRQQIIDGYIADFYCHAAGLIVEVDGGIHIQQNEYDREREINLQQHNFRILRFRNEEILKRLPDVLQKIKSELSMSSCLPPPLSGEGTGERSEGVSK